MGIRRRLYYAAAILVGTMLVGSMGYYILFEGKSSYLDCLYMTVISLTTVGYGEVLGITGNLRAQIFTMLLITFGMGIILYSISTVTAMLIEGELTGMLRRRKMENKIKALSGHYIVCGGGETGFPLAVELVTSKASVVLIEQDNAVIEQSRQYQGTLPCPRRCHRRQEPDRRRDRAGHRHHHLPAVGQRQPVHHHDGPYAQSHGAHHQPHDQQPAQTQAAQGWRHFSGLPQRHRRAAYGLRDDSAGGGGVYGQHAQKRAGRIAHPPDCRHTATPRWQARRS